MPIYKFWMASYLYETFMEYHFYNKNISKNTQKIDIYLYF